MSKPAKPARSAPPPPEGATPAAWRRARLAPPVPGTRPAVVIDTDAANEIDDPFALAWALLSPERLDLQAVYAAPFSFAHRLRALQQVARLRAGPAPAEGSRANALLQQHGPKLDDLARRGHPLASLADPAAWPMFCTPGEGMARSLDEVHRVFAALRLDPAGRVLAGSTRYLDKNPAEPEPSPATEHLIATARARPADGPPLYVLAIGCPTNVANALLLAPDIARRIVVVWTSGYPSHAPQPNVSLNLEQDLAASRVLLHSGVPLVYLPGFHVGAQLRLSLPELLAFVPTDNAIGRHLQALYLNNPLADWGGFDVQAPGFSWVIWDLINVAWLLNPEWVPSSLQPTPALADDLRWQAPAPGAPLMREAHGVARDAVFADLFATLARAPA